MNHPDDVARLREIKRLLERIQRLPRLASLQMNGSSNGLLAEHHAGPANGLHNSHLGPPHPTVDVGLSLELEREPTGLPLPDPPLDPFPPSFDPARGDDARSDYWASVHGDSRALVPVRASTGSPGVSPWVFIAATAVNTAVAAVLAVVITLGVARRDAVPAEAEKVAAIVKPEVAPAVELLPLGSRSEPLRLEALKPARLPFEVRPEEAAQDSYILVLTGLPANAALSGANRIGTDTWHLAPGALHRLEIVVPEWSATVYEVGVELRRTNGVVAARSKLWLAVPPPSAPTGASLDQAALKELVGRGDKLLSRGDVAAARGMYERAAAMGSAQAALAMGATYDPRRLWAQGVFGMVGNKERARHWYRRADELGHPEAKARINSLQ